MTYQTSTIRPQASPLGLRTRRSDGNSPEVGRVCSADKIETPEKWCNVAFDTGRRKTTRPGDNEGGGEGPDWTGACFDPTFQTGTRPYRRHLAGIFQDNGKPLPPLRRQRAVETGREETCFTGQTTAKPVRRNGRMVQPTKKELAATRLARKSSKTRPQRSSPHRSQQRRRTRRW